MWCFHLVYITEKRHCIFRQPQNHSKNIHYLFTRFLQANSCSDCRQSTAHKVLPANEALSKYCGQIDTPQSKNPTTVSKIMRLFTKLMQGISVLLTIITKQVDQSQPVSPQCKVWIFVHNFSGGVHQATLKALQKLFTLLQILCKAVATTIVSRNRNLAIAICDRWSWFQHICTDSNLKYWIKVFLT